MNRIINAYIPCGRILKSDRAENTPTLSVDRCVLRSYTEIMNMINNDHRTVPWSPVYNSIRNVNGGKLTIKDMINLYGNCIIYVENGGQLIIDGGTLQDACLQLGYGSSLTIRNKGIIKMRSNCNFDSPQGAVVNVEYGSIQ